MILVGDIGGTNCRYALFERGADQRASLRAIHTWKTSESSGLRADLERYTKLISGSPKAACVAIAGPVDKENVSLTNQRWTGQLSDFPCPGYLCNDLAAAANALFLPSLSFEPLFGKPCRSGFQVMVGLGTGYGQALVYDDGYRVWSTEAGHACYAPSTEAQRKLLSFLQPTLGRVRVEDVCSGRGMENIVDYLEALSGRRLDRQRSAGQLLGEGAETDSLLAFGLDLFLSSLGSVLGDTVLRCMPAGGLWLCGGVAQKMSRHFQRDSFCEAWFDKKPMKHLVQSTSLALVVEDQIGLLGAGLVAERLFDKRST